ncbi:hypothetical protein CHS0354_001989 [Potamilus streckersoni]|uniref:LysM domain-containing protein n=1 Tax=Potamilus streckersoni TaxID=2493646 RepID=A0AAE0T5W0_9BIVA|nr:hypothetical protein CHS0354_001989 [Potamilus streckersoni]
MIFRDFPIFSTLFSFSRRYISGSVLLCIFAVSLTGCSFAAKEEPKVEQPPDWFINPPQQDRQFLYGTGSHSNKTRATELALKEIAAGISVSIKSSSTSQSFKSGLTTGSRFSESVESEVQKMQFSNYETENQVLINNKYYVRIKIAKAVLTQNTRDNFEDKDRKNQEAVKLASSQPKLNKLFTLKKAEKELTEAYNTLILLRGMQKGDAFAELDEDTTEKDIMRYEGYFASYQQLLSSVTLNIKADNDFLPIAKAVSTMLSDEGIKNAVNGGGSYDGTLIISGNAEKGVVQSYKSITYNSVFTLAQDNKSLSTASKSITGYSVQSHESAAEDASRKLADTTCSVLVGPGEENGILYIWKQGDSIKQIAEKYNVNYIDLKKVNDIYDEKDLTPGTAIFIPGNYLPSEQEINDLKLIEEAEAQKNTSFKNAGTEGMIWPSYGDMSSGYGKRNAGMHYGIDIRANRGRDIYSVQDGIVEYTGWRSSFGQVIIVRHSQDVKTLYAHTSYTAVEKGQPIKKGQKIGMMGATGRATGVHLHFEIHIKNRPYNPARYLPSRN